MSSDFEYVEVGAGQTYNRSLGNGDRMENVLIDITADKADININAHGNGWVIRNVGIRGHFDIGDSSPGGDTSDHEGGTSNAFNLQSYSHSNPGVFENVYIPRVRIGVDKTAVQINDNHTGHIVARNCWTGGHSTAAWYVAGFGREQTGGTLRIENCYFENASIAHVRVGGDVEIDNSVICNTGEAVYTPRTFGGAMRQVWARGIWDNEQESYGTTQVNNTHIDIRQSNTCDPPWPNHNGCATLTAVNANEGRIVLNDCEVLGPLSGDVVQNNVGNNPDTTPPPGCPTSPEEAAGGEGPSFDYGFVVDGANTGSDIAEYRFTVAGDVTPSTRWGGIINQDILEVTDLGDGRFMVEDAIANVRNSYEVTGCIEDFRVLSGEEPEFYKVTDGTENQVPLGDVPDCATLSCATPSGAVQENTSFPLDVTVQNITDIDREYEIGVRVDGDMAHRITVQVAAGDSETVTEDVPVGAPGQYGVSVEVEYARSLQ